MIDIQYINPFQKMVATEANLQAAIPASFQGFSGSWRSPEATRMTLSQLDTVAGDLVLHQGFVVQVELFGESVSHYAPLIFIKDGCPYYVDYSHPPIQVGHVIQVPVIPLIFSLNGYDFACSDIPTLTSKLSRSSYLYDWYVEAVSKRPKLSFELLRAAELNLTTVSVLEASKSNVLLAARPEEDWDLSDQYFICGFDEGREFISQLPYRAYTINEALQFLNPLNYAQLKTAIRQGEWWFYEDQLPVSEKDLHPESVYKTYGFKPPRKISKALRRARILRSGGRETGPDHGYTETYSGHIARLEDGSSHFADMVVDLGGAVWVKGTVRHLYHHHEPAKLRKGQWYRAVKNGAIRSYSKTLPRGQ